MDTSLAEDIQHNATRLQKDSFFFMSPYRSFTTSGCFRRFSTPAVGGDDPQAPSSNSLPRPLPMPKPPDC
ncbi:Isochorismate synthase entC [Leclercia adecarboxylata]|uniref:Isochorismate synthase entC n=1 Tax=Leclercia adecarboxylata TaxID=83655 RepID=A0A4U9HLJ2_9ENTR|nr:Isochorismate synthase entC [Leclercia adecarboxylata]